MLIANDHKDNIFRGPGSNSRSRHYDLRDLLCPASKSQYGLNIAILKRRKSSKQPTYRRKSNVIEAYAMQRSANNTTHWSTYSK